MQIINDIEYLVRLLLPTRLRQSRVVRLVLSLLHRTWEHFQAAYNYFVREYEYMKYTSQVASLNKALYLRFGGGCYAGDRYTTPDYFGEGVADPRFLRIVSAVPDPNLKYPYIIYSGVVPAYICEIHIPFNRVYTKEEVDAFVRRYLYLGIRYTIVVDPDPNDPNSPTPIGYII